MELNFQNIGLKIDIKLQKKRFAYNSWTQCILEEFHTRQKGHGNTEDKKFDVIRAAARLLRSDLKVVESTDKYYPLIETDVEKHVQFLPPTLKLLLEEERRL